MLLKLSSSSNDSTDPPPPSSTNSTLNMYMYCLISSPSSFIFITIDINIICLILPLCIFILHHGLRKRATSAALSHSDCFTFHMVAMEMLGVFGYTLNLAAICRRNLTVIFIGEIFTSITWFGQLFFHILTCVERYVAVVHPITYLRLKNQRGIRIRTFTITCVWLLSVAGMMVMTMTDFFHIIDFSLLALSFTSVSFCSLSVLCALVRPGPSEQAGTKEPADQTKQKAFNTICIILAVLVVRLVWNVVWEVIFLSGWKSHCVLMSVCVWFNVPSSLVLPLLFLHREGKLSVVGKSAK